MNDKVIACTHAMQAHVSPVKDVVDVLSFAHWVRFCRDHRLSGMPATLHVYTHTHTHQRQHMASGHQALNEMLFK